MTSKKRMATAVLSGVGMIMLILDSKTALTGAAEGIDICIRTVIPSLFPFFVLSSLLTSAAATNMPFLNPLGKLCGIPKGSEHLLLIGLLGGYPVGAQAVAEAYNSGAITKRDAHRMLGFCSNAGPAFIFGIAGGLFSSKITALLLWLIHIVSALIAAMVLPGKRNSTCTIHNSKILSLPSALTKSLRIMSGVCGWVILFRILITFLDRWLLWILPDPIRLLTSGVLELTNGCCSLLQTPSEMVRFILSSVILSFGGICIGMQTITVTGDLGTGCYFPGKLLQTLLSTALSVPTAMYLFKGHKSMVPFLVTLLVLIIGFSIYKKTVAFLGNRVYNN